MASRCHRVADGVKPGSPWWCRRPVGARFRSRGPRHVCQHHTIGWCWQSCWESPREGVGRRSIFCSSGNANPRTKNGEDRLSKAPPRYSRSHRVAITAPFLKVVTFGYVFVEDVGRHSWKTCTPPTPFLGRREYT